MFQCATGFRSYDHEDVNLRLRRSAKLEHCNLVNLVTDLEALGEKLQTEYHDVRLPEDIEKLNLSITNGIYDALLKNKKKRRTVSNELSILLNNHNNCDSKHFKSIAEANELCYQFHLEKRNISVAYNYRDLWLKYQELAYIKEDEEIVKSKCSQWKALNKENPKKMWELIDWKDSSSKQKDEIIPARVIEKFFCGIFQAPFLLDKPTITDASEMINEYLGVCEDTDKDILSDELKIACKKMKRGKGIDGIPPQVMSLVPEGLLNMVRMLYNGIFGNYQPKQWNSQLLLSFPKKGHTFQNPSMRGIGIGVLLSRLYDVIMDNRFRNWYNPNIEQAGFREKQGCPPQLFALLLLIDVAKIIGKDLFIGVIDYEKAFDFTNRYLLAKDLINNGIGKRFLDGFVNSYRTTNYIIKTSATTIGNSILTDHGVTQGKSSSADYFSLFISDMGTSVNSIDTSDFMDPYCLFQLADDTTVVADNICSFIRKMDATSIYSILKFLKIHPTKSIYFHLTNGIPFSEDIVVNKPQRCWLLLAWILVM